MRLAEVLKIAVQIAGALAAAHAKGIVHRDLKPANVMVSDRRHGEGPGLRPGQARRGHAGVPRVRNAAPAAAHTDAGAILGTAAYMSPEQAEGKPVDARSDIFSFGAMLYEMVTGRRAFHGDTGSRPLSAMLHQEPKPLEGAAPRSGATHQRCLRKDPAKRFQHMDDVCVALEELKEESDSGKLGTAVAAAPGSTLRRTAAYGAAALLVLLAAAVAAWRWGAPREPVTPPRLVPLTTFAGYELHPAFSPDGKQVAFSWNGPKEDNFDIYVMMSTCSRPSG